MKLILFLIVLSVATKYSLQNEVYDEVNEIFDNEVISSITGCQINIHTVAVTPQPLYIRPGTEQFFHPSDRRGIIEMNAGDRMELFCTNFVSPVSASGLITIECVNGIAFNFQGTIFNFNEFACASWPTSTAVRRTGASSRCFNNAVLVDVGFQIPNRFLRVYTSCHDAMLEANHYTIYQLTPRSEANQRNVNRPSWRQLDFFSGKNVDNLHTRVVQRQTIADILQSQAKANIFIEEPNSEIFLARGHMAAMTDFILANEQRSTFLFINTAPQWQTVRT
jgi:hypothetical protein